MSRVTLLSILISILTLISGSPVINNDVDQNAKNIYPTVEMGEKSIEHKTTSLLTEALQMIHKTRDFKERKWLESFVQRLAKLASELEENSNSEVQNDNKPTGQDKAIRLQNENEVLVSGKEKMPLVKIPSSTEVVYSESPVAANFVEKELDTFNPLQIKVPETTPEADMISRRVVPLETSSATDQPNPTTHSETLNRVGLQRQIFEKNELLKEIFNKIQKLKEIGGSQQDVINLLKRSDENESPSTINDQEDIEFEEEGAATGELEADMSDISTLAPSLGHVTSNTLSSSRKPEEDDLVKQLEGEKFLLVNPDERGKDEEVLRRINGLVAPSVV
ncbi:uncharacterized protein [Centruroides vittatus]|uniref:uncharacterized protein n=1 Tax=Centruroides vittatus TaxID=120091 RepID=UPI0035105088